MFIVSTPRGPNTNRPYNPPSNEAWHRAVRLEREMQGVVRTHSHSLVAGHLQMKKETAHKHGCEPALESSVQLLITFLGHVRLREQRDVAPSDTGTEDLVDM